MTVLRSHSYHPTWSVPGAPQGYCLEESDSVRYKFSAAETIHSGSAWMMPGAPQGLSVISTSVKSEESLAEWGNQSSDCEVLSVSSTSTGSSVSYDDTRGSIMMAEFMKNLCVDNQCRPTPRIYPTEDHLDAQFGGRVRKTHVNIKGLMVHSAFVLEKQMCKKISVLGSGTFNKVFVLVFTDETEILARVKYDHAEIHTSTLESEIATIAFLKKHGPKIPVPEVVYWDSSAQNPSERPFMLMKRLPGVKIVELPSFEGMSRWVPGISMDSEIQTVLDNVARMHAELVRPLPTGPCGFASLKIGQMRLNKNAPDYELGQCHGDTPIEIGPFVSTNYDTEPDLNNFQNGPFGNIWEFFNGLKERSKRQLLLETIPNYGQERQEENEVPNVAPNVKTNEAVSCLIDISAILSLEGRKNALPLTPSSEELCLWHVDLGLWNILVDPKTLDITGILDWEDAAVLPLVLAASTSSSLIPLNANQKARRFPDGLPHDPTTSDITQKTSHLHHHSSLDNTTTGTTGLRPSFTGSRFYGLGLDVDLETPAEGTDFSMEDAHQVEITWLRRWYRMTMAALDPRFGARIWQDHEAFYRLACCLKQSPWRNVDHRKWIANMAEKAVSEDRNGELEPKLKEDCFRSKESREMPNGKGKFVKDVSKSHNQVIVEHDSGCVHQRPTSASGRGEGVWRKDAARQSKVNSGRHGLGTGSVSRDYRSCEMDLIWDLPDWKWSPPEDDDSVYSCIDGLFS
ncbi:MAG: hypothetical protein M1812_003255 [Candelaria pacifica]|nr:MAG: hypothetical protein M1812_003255 [Candelaria pacifica]